MQGWLRSKLDHITTEFLDGGGYGAVYEAQFRAYLECLLVTRGQSANFWERFKEACEGEKPHNLAYYIEDRQELVDALQAFQKRFNLPRKVDAVSVPEATAQNEPVTSSGDDGALDLFDLLGED